MPADYDAETFNEMYVKCSAYMDKLARGINPRYFNVTDDIVRSWFDDKFIWIYTKYHNEMSDKALLPHILKGLKTFQAHVMMKAYSEKADMNMRMMSMDNEELWAPHQLEAIPDESKGFQDNDLVREVKARVKEILGNTDAYTLFEMQLNPPPMVLGDESGDQDSAWAKFFGLPLVEESFTYIHILKEEISRAISQIRKRVKRGTLKFQNPYW